MVAIVENLFIGNKLEQSEIRICDCCTIDLRRIRNPFIIFASYGDNITPPHQALGWIPAVYRVTNDLKAAKQRIVYLTNPHVGHLGIFVSAGVARFEHRAILESLTEIEALAPGLYEMKIDNPTGDPDCHRSQYSVRFEERDVKALRFNYPRKAFERVQQVSEINDRLYQTFVSPWVQAIVNPWTAEAMKWLHPMRINRYLFSESFNPWMRGIAALAAAVAKDRTPLPENQPFLKEERKAIERASEAIERTTSWRDAAEEQAFNLIYGQ